MFSPKGMSKIPSSAELSKNHLSLTELLEAQKLIDSKLVKRLLEVLKANAPRAEVDPSSAHASLAAYTKQEGFLYALDLLQNLNRLKTVEDVISELTPKPLNPLLDPKD